MTKFAGILLILLYSSALFAGFLSPYSPNEEFRSLFFHPPSSIHFQNADGKLCWPFVKTTYLLDENKHLFAEGAPVSLMFRFPELNTNPYIAESLDPQTWSASIKDDKGQLLTTISSLKETGVDTGIFQGIAAIDVSEVQNLIVDVNGKPYTVPVNETGRPNDVYLEKVEQGKNFPLQFFVRGSGYRFLGISSDLHFFGVAKPGHIFLLGTDQSGRDILSRIFFGARISLTVGLIGVLLTTLFGWTVGGIAGYFGGKLDSVLMRIADILMAIPALYLILAVRNVFPIRLSSHITYILMIVVLSVTGWALMSRVIRGMVLSLREEQFVLAAQSQGASAARILFRHILPATAGYVIVRAALLIPSYILAEATLSFLGVGIQEPVPSWGNMLATTQDLRVLSEFSWSLAPGIFLFLAVLAFNFLGEGIRKRLSIREV